MTPCPPPEDAAAAGRALARAVEWLVWLRSGDASAADRTAYAAWLASDPRHRDAVKQIEQAIGPVACLREQGVQAALANQALQRVRRRAVLRAGGAAASAGALLGAAWLSTRALPLAEWTANWSTGRAERQQQQLADGSRLWLDARTAVDAHADARERELILYRGRLQLGVVSMAPGPMRLQTPQGPGLIGPGRFVLHQPADGPVLLTTLQGAAWLGPPGRCVRVAAGQQARLDSGRTPTLCAARGTEDRWIDGRMAMNQQPLGDLVEALARYRAGRLTVSAAAAALPVSGDFSLDDSEATLARLAATLPVRLQAWTRYWVAIDLAG